MTKFVDKVKYFQRSQNQPRRTTEQWRARRRVKELMLIFKRQYPKGLPHNELGYKCAKYIIRTLAFDPIDKREQWLDRYAPWLDVDNRAKLLSYGPHWYGARSLGNNLELHEIDRQELDIRTIESFDVTPEQREAYNLEKDSRRQEKTRRAKGVPTREQYLATCKTKSKPWEAEGFKCRRTWERHNKKATRECVSQLESASLLTYKQTDASCDNPVFAAKPMPPALTFAQAKPPMGGRSGAWAKMSLPSAPLEQMRNAA